VNEIATAVYAGALGFTIWRSLEAVGYMNKHTWHPIRCVFILLSGASAAMLLWTVADAIDATQLGLSWPEMSMSELSFGLAVAALVGIDRRRGDWVANSMRKAEQKGVRA